MRPNLPFQRPRRKAKLLSTLIGQKAGTARLPIKEVGRCCGFFQGLNEERNRMIHGAWNVQDGAVRRYKRSARAKAGFRITVTKTSHQAVNDLAAKYRDAERKLWEIVPL